MATYTIANDIIPAVRKILDYNETEDALDVVSEVDTLALDTIITSQAQNGLRWCMMNCPKEWVTWSQPTATGKVVQCGTTTEHYYFQQDLPDGYVRFGSAKLDSWNVPCYSVVSPDDKEYVKQFGEFDGLMATAMRPVTALLNTTTSSGENAYLQMFGAVDDDTTLTYCNIAVLPDMTKGWSMKSQLLQPMVCMVAAFVAEVLKDSAKANILLSQAQTLLTTEEESKRTAIMQAALAQQQNG